MATIGYGELDAPGGQGLVPMARAARDGFCGIYRASPDWLLAENLPAPLNFGMEGLMRRICPPPLAPPPPGRRPPFGQCPGVPYVVRYRQLLTDGDGSPVYLDFEGNYPANLPGRITGVRRVGAANNSNDPQARAIFYLGYNNGADEVQLFDASVFKSNASCYIVSVTRADGQPDACEPPIFVYPPSPPPDPADLSFDVNIDIGGNNFTVPFVFIPTVIAPRIFFEPELTVNVGGVDFNFNAGGVDVNVPIDVDIPINFPTSPDPRPTPPPPRPPRPDSPPVDLAPVIDRIDTLDDKVDGIIPVLDQLLDCDRCVSLPIDLDDYEIITLSEANSFVAAIPINCDFVTLKLENIPRNAKQMTGVDAPDIVFAGWLEFGNSLNWYPRNPVQFESSCFNVPEGADRVAYTLQEGYTGVLRLFFQMENI